MLYSFIQNITVAPQIQHWVNLYWIRECSITKPTCNLDAQRFLWVQKLCYHECPENISVVFTVKLFTNTTSSLPNTCALGSAQNIIRCASCGAALDLALATAHLLISVQASVVGKIFWLHCLPHNYESNFWKHCHCVWTCVVSGSLTAFFLHYSLLN